MSETSEELHKVKVKIKKLLAIAEHAAGNEHETAIAAGQAAKLMAKYQIEHADIINLELKKGDGLVGEAIHDMEFTAWPRWLQHIAIELAKAFECTVRFSLRSRSKQIEVCGYAPDVQLVQWLYAFIYDEFTRQSESYAKNYKLADGRRNIRQVKNEFKRGASTSLTRRLKQIVIDRESAQAGTGLMLVKSQAIAQKFGAARYSTQRSATNITTDAYQQGQCAGDKINMSRPMSSQASKKQLP